MLVASGGRRKPFCFFCFSKYCSRTNTSDEKYENFINFVDRTLNYFPLNNILSIIERVLKARV